MRCNDWIPENITLEEDFLHHDLEAIRDDVLKNRHEDISVYLWAYECRVLLANISQEIEFFLNDLDLNSPVKRKLFSWENCRNYFHTDRKGKYHFEISKRDFKRCFLRGWLEVQMWEHGNSDHQVHYLVDDNFGANQINQILKNNDVFIDNESINFSILIMKNYQKFLLGHLADKKQYRFVNFKESVTLSDNNWSVWVSPKLFYYYYGDDSRLIMSKARTIFFSSNMFMEMKPIICAKKTETRHMVIANYISWQDFLHIFQTEKGDSMPINTVLTKFENLKENASKDKTKISNDMKEILKAVSVGTKISELPDHKQQYLNELCDKSPKIKLLLRLAQHQFIRSSIGSYIFFGLQEIQQKNTQKPIMNRWKDFLYNLKEYFIDGSISLYEWNSHLWQPQFAGQHISACDIPEDNHHFLMNDGEIHISCLWRGAYRNAPAYIQVKWKANLSVSYEIWIAFINPETQSVFSEIFLGTHLEGGKVIPDNVLKFDPTKTRWATFVQMKKTGQ